MGELELKGKESKSVEGKEETCAEPNLKGKESFMRRKQLWRTVEASSAEG